MNLNWTTEVIVIFISIIPISISFFLILYKYIKIRDLVYFIMLIGWGCFIIGNFMEALAYLFLLKDLFRFRMYIYIFQGYCVLILLDIVARKSIDPIKLTFFSLLSGMAIIFSYESSAIILYRFPNGEISIGSSGNFRLVIFFIALFQGILLVYFFFKIFWKAPKNLKSFSLLNLIGAVLVSIIPGIFYLVGMTMVLPGCVMLLFGIGTLLISIAFVFQPKLSYILPFKVYHLIVIETTSGLPLYKYSWIIGDELGELNPQVFSSLLHGIDLLIEDTVHRGTIQEIDVEKAILIMDHYHSISCVLITSKASLVLRKALNRFCLKFWNKFSDVIDNPSKLSQFNSTKELVEEYFAFIPFSS